MILLALIGFIVLFTIIFLLVRKIYQLSLAKGKIANKSRKSGKNKINTKMPFQKDQFSCAFFHPNCSAGGGGERTLYAALLSVNSKFPEAKLALFIKANTKNQNTLPEIRKKALDDFNLEIPNDLLLIPLKTVFLAESKTWSRFTLLGQIVGSIFLGLEAMYRFRPDVLIDTAGFPFIYPIIKLFECNLVAYVHYPFISSDMIQKLQAKSYNNSGLIASNSMLRNAKIAYYKYLTKIYSFCGKCCDLAFTNSTWTNRHIIHSWTDCPSIKLLYPPCDLSPFINRIQLNGKKSDPIQVLSLSQFRPEKNHRLQLEIAAQVVKKCSNVKFIFVGSCRGDEDENRVKELKEYAEKLNISYYVEFKVNLPFDELLNTLQKATIGLHTMVDEHFGIGIVELMASGLITVANNSGGPRADIIKKDIGYLCSSTSEYSETIIKISSMSENDRMNIANRARINVVNRFSGEIFAERFADILKNTLIK